LMSLAGLQQMKREGKKIVAVVAWDYQIAQIADRAGVDLVSVGDSVGVNLWGRQEGEISLDEMLIVCKAVRRGVKRALLSCDLPEKENPDAAVRLLREGGADMVKLLASPETVRAVVRSGVPVFAEFHGDNATPENLVKQAKHLEQAGASLLDFPPFRARGRRGSREGSLDPGARRTRRRPVARRQDSNGARRDRLRSFESEF